MLIAAILSLLAVLFSTIDMTRLCIKWIELSLRGERSWPENSISRVKERLGCDGEVANAWILFQAFGRVTGAVQTLIYYPVIVVLLVFFSRSSYFDNWGLPLPLIIVVGAILFAAVLCGYQLHKSAIKGRDRLVERLQVKAIRMEGDRRIGMLIAQIKQYREGAYVKLSQRPVVRATLLLLGGAGLIVSEFMSMSR